MSASRPGRTHYAIGWLLLAYVFGAVLFLAWREFVR